MINHASTDRSVEIIRALTPSWKIVNSTLLEFDTFLTDFEVMQYERGLPGWKIALNVTEFCMPTLPLATLETTLVEIGRTGCALSGIVMVDHMPGSTLDIDVPLPLQCFHGIDENAEFDPKVRLEMGLGPIATRNRFYHCNEVGMYQPGRHHSHHHDASFRIQDVMIFAYGASPWNEAMKRRKLQIKSKIKDSDLKIGWGHHHTKLLEEHEADFLKLQKYSTDLRSHPVAGPAILKSCSYANFWTRA